MTYTVLGASGFIGSHLVRRLQSQGLDCEAPARGASLLGRPLGHVIYCIGLSADWRKRPYETVRAHVSILLDILEKAEFESLLYLSTTRVYAETNDAHEGAVLGVNFSNPDQLYNTSKIMGESVCLGCPRSHVRVVRMSHVYGDDFASDNFIFSVLRDAVDRKLVKLRTSLESERDYVDVEDVVTLLPLIAASGRQRIYNIASGMNITNRQVVEVLQRQTGCRVEVPEGAPAIRFPPIPMECVREEFDFTPTSNVLDSLPGLVEEYQRKLPVH
jgi:nucleoside-diphosphate-sugar epimerase